MNLSVVYTLEEQYPLEIKTCDFNSKMNQNVSNQSNSEKFNLL